MTSKEHHERFKNYKDMFNKKISNTIEQYNEEYIELFKTNINKIIKNIHKEYEDNKVINTSKYNTRSGSNVDSSSSSGSGSSSDTDDLSYEDLLNKKLGEELDKIIIKKHKKYEMEIKNILDSELTTFLNKTLFMIFDIKRKQEQTTEMMISNLVNHYTQSSEDGSSVDDDEEEDINNEESSIKLFLERFNLNSSDNEDMENLDEINTNCINSDNEDEENEDDENEENEDDENEDEENEENEDDENEENEDEDDEEKIEREQKEFLNEKTVNDLKAIAKTLDIPLKCNGKHKSKSTLINEIYDKEKEELN